ncbi:MAG: hypothetical protein JRJ00_02040 [Deltaproteobacteria bacterium]|nr:hypothetical protein [Deltaproteobacteria bacterium]
MYSSALLNHIKENPLGINILEEKYQLILQNGRVPSDQFSQWASNAANIQEEIRSILNHLTSRLCSQCEHVCCEGFPVEGWFSVEDYILFRAKYDKPIPPLNRIERDTACFFLAPGGCSLPEDLRPFTCVKINCEKLTDSIKAQGKEHRFNQLKNSLDDIRREVSLTIHRHSPDSSCKC